MGARTYRHSHESGNLIIKLFKAFNNEMPNQVGHDVQERLLAFKG
jgi:hypothetical protein